MSFGIVFIDRNELTRSIQHSRSTFIKIQRLKSFSVAIRVFLFAVASIVLANKFTLAK